MYAYPTFCFSIHPSMDICVSSTLWLLWKMLLQTQMYKHLFNTLLSTLLGQHPEVELLDHMITLSFLRNIHTVSTMAAAFYILTDSAKEFQFLYVVANTCCFQSYYFFYSGHSNGYEVVSHPSFDLHFPDDWSCWANAYWPCVHILWRNVYSNPARSQTVRHN